MDTAHLGRAFHGGQHYENFPVASWLIPARVRPAMLSLYRFARTADDLADEGDLSSRERLDGLERLEEGLLLGRDGHAPLPADTLLLIGSRLGSALRQHACAADEALALLKAFRADVEHQPMADDQAVLSYCRHSAVPIGRLVLGLFGILQQDPLDPEGLWGESDAICTGLQLANFAQDLGEDVHRGRIYFPKAWWPTGWSPDQGVVALSVNGRAMIATQMADWAASKLQEGAHLPRRIRLHPRGGARLALELALTVEGGRRIAGKVRQDPQQVWQASPRLSRTDLMVLLFRALRLTYVS